LRAFCGHERPSKVHREVSVGFSDGDAIPEDLTANLKHLVGEFRRSPCFDLADDR